MELDLGRIGYSLYAVISDESPQVVGRRFLELPELFLRPLKSPPQVDRGLWKVLLQLHVVCGQVQEIGHFHRRHGSEAEAQHGVLDQPELAVVQI